MIKAWPGLRKTWCVGLYQKTGYESACLEVEETVNFYVQIGVLRMWLQFLCFFFRGIYELKGEAYFVISWATIITPQCTLLTRFEWNCILQNYCDVVLAWHNSDEPRLTTDCHQLIPTPQRTGAVRVLPQLACPSQSRELQNHSLETYSKPWWSFLDLQR